MSGLHGKVKTHTPLLSAMGKLQADAEHVFEVPEGRNTVLYLLDGGLSVSGHGLVDNHQMIAFENENTTRSEKETVIQNHLE